MKRVWLCAAGMLLFGMGMNAGELADGDEAVPEQVGRPKVQGYLRGGVSVLTVKGDAKVMDPCAGYDFSVGFRRRVSDKGFYWGMEFGLGSRGWDFDDEDYSFNLMAHNVRWLPLNLGYLASFTDDCKLDVHAGVYLSVDYACTANAAGYVYDEVSNDFWYVDESYKLKDLDDYQRCDAGIQIGIGLWYKRFNVDFTYHRGFVDMETGNVLTCYTNNYMIRVGCSF